MKTILEIETRYHNSIDNLWARQSLENHQLAWVKIHHPDYNKPGEYQTRIWGLFPEIQFNGEDLLFDIEPESGLARFYIGSEEDCHPECESEEVSRDNSSRGFWYADCCEGSNQWRPKFAYVSHKNFKFKIGKKMKSRRKKKILSSIKREIKKTLKMVKKNKLQGFSLGRKSAKSIKLQSIPLIGLQAHGVRLPLYPPKKVYVYIDKFYSIFKASPDRHFEIEELTPAADSHEYRGGTRRWVGGSHLSIESAIEDLKCHIAKEIASSQEIYPKRDKTVG